MGGAGGWSACGVFPARGSRSECGVEYGIGERLVSERDDNGSLHLGVVCVRIGGHCSECFLGGCVGDLGIGGMAVRCV